MIHRISERMISWQIAKGNLTESQRNKYVYAYEVMFNQLVNLSVAVVLAFVSDELIAVLLFLLIYIPLRKYAGGFHAESNEKCIIYSSLVIICVIVINKALYDVTNAYEGIGMICFVLMLAFVWHMAPIETKNKKLDELERRRYRRKVHIICIIHILLMVWNVLIRKRTCISINILLAYATVVGVLAIGHQKMKSRNQNKV